MTAGAGCISWEICILTRLKQCREIPLPRERIAIVPAVIAHSKNEKADSDTSGAAVGFPIAAIQRMCRSTFAGAVNSGLPNTSIFYTLFVGMAYTLTGTLALY